MQNNNKIKPLILLILDGWGISPNSKGNAIALGNTSVIDKLSKDYLYTELSAHGRSVGLPKYQNGNSEAGHMNIGAGRIVGQDVKKISQSIADGTFLKNPAFLQAIKHVKKNNSNLHFMGLLSNGMSAHSDPYHLEALLNFAKKHKINKSYIHIFTDGRDSPQHAAIKLIQELEKKFTNNEKIATIMGRYYGMDRKKSWPITEQAYDVLTCPKCVQHASESATNAITESYNRNNTDEFMEPYVIHEKNKPLPRIKNNDAIIFFNLRSDRARQITKAFVQEKFKDKNKKAFKRKNVLKNLCFVAMTDFGPDLDNVLSAFPSVDLKETLPMQLKDKRQIYIAETEKYAHVTYFFNGGYANGVANEERIMIPSPDMKSYDKKPAMSSKELTDKLLFYIKKDLFDFITINYACPDMIGHTGNLNAAIEAINAVNDSLAKVIKEAEKKDIQIIITSDHGNVEEMINLKTGEIDTEHSTNPVPFIIFDKKLKGKKKNIRTKGILGDIAPTILQLLGMEKPKGMGGKTLIKP